MNHTKSRFTLFFIFILIALIIGIVISTVVLLQNTDLGTKKSKAAENIAASANPKAEGKNNPVSESRENPKSQQQTKIEGYQCGGNSCNNGEQYCKNTFECISTSSGEGITQATPKTVTARFCQSSQCNGGEQYCSSNNAFECTNDSGNRYCGTNKCNNGEKYCNLTNSSECVSNQDSGIRFCGSNKCNGEQYCSASNAFECTKAATNCGGNNCNSGEKFCSATNSFQCVEDTLQTTSTPIATNTPIPTTTFNPTPSVCPSGKRYINGTCVTNDNATCNESGFGTNFKCGRPAPNGSTSVCNSPVDGVEHSCCAEGYIISDQNTCIQKSTGTAECTDGLQMYIYDFKKSKACGNSCESGTIDSGNRNCIPDCRTYGNLSSCQCPSGLNRYLSNDKYICSTSQCSSEQKYIDGRCVSSCNNGTYDSDCFCNPGLYKISFPTGQYGCHSPLPDEACKISYGGGVWTAKVIEPIYDTYIGECYPRNSVACQIFYEDPSMIFNGTDCIIPAPSSANEATAFSTPRSLPIKIDSNGTKFVTLPNDLEPGDHKVEFRNNGVLLQTNNLSIPASTAITIKNNLPKTGINNDLVILIGISVSLIVVGGAMVKINADRKKRLLP